MDGNILVLGYGFIGSHLDSYLRSNGEQVLSVGRQCKLKAASGNFKIVCDTTENLYDLIADNDIKYVFNMVGKNGGIKYNQEYKYDIFVENVDTYNRIFAQLRRAKVKKVVSLIASCAYGNSTPLFEQYFLSGEPDSTIAGHGHAKRHLFILSRLFSEDTGIPAVCACPPTIFGPNDHMDDRAKVVDSMVLRCIESAKRNEEEFVVWGDGTPLRQIMYVKDLCPMLLDVMYKYDDYDCPINLSSPYQVSITELANIVMELVGHPGKITFDPSKPNGQIAKFLSPDRMIKYLGKQELTDLKQSLKETVEWYKNEVWSDAPELGAEPVGV